MFNENIKITRELNEILIERIRKYQSQDITQLLNSPNDGDKNNSYLGGLINFVGENSNNTFDDEINNDLDKISIKEIYIKPQQDNEYINELIEEIEEEKEEQSFEEKNNEQNEDSPELEEKNISENEKKEEENMIIPFISKKNPDSIRILLEENFNNYFDLIAKNYEKYTNNHFPTIIINEKNSTKKVMLANLKNKIYYTQKGEKIIVNDDIYETSLAYLKNKEIYSNIPLMFKKNNAEFTLDFNLLDKSIDNIRTTIFEFIEINKLISTSISKIISFCSQLHKYVNDKFEPFNNAVNLSYEKVNHEKQIISEIKEKTLKNSGHIILKTIKMNNSIKLVNKLKQYLNLKKYMNNVESLILNQQNYQKTCDSINECKEEIEKIKNENNNIIKRESSSEIKENIKKSDKKLIRELKSGEIKETEKNDPIIEIFEKKLIEYKYENDNHMSNELTKLLNNYFNNYIIIENEKEINEDKKEKMEQYEKYNISKFVLEKIFSFSENHTEAITSFHTPSPEEELEKISNIYDYFIENDLIADIYRQLKEIFGQLSEQVMNKILFIFNEKFKTSNEPDNIPQEKSNQDNEGAAQTENIPENENKENNDENIVKEEEEEKEKEKEKDIEKNNDENNKNEICALLCVITCKNKLFEDISSFLEALSKKLENKEENKEKQTKEIQDIQASIKNNIQNLLIIQIQKCLHTISSQNDIDSYINYFYLTLEMLQNEIQNYEIEKNKNDDDNNENIENNNNVNNLVENNKLFKIIIEEQNIFIENWLNYHLSKLEFESSKSWETLKEIQPKYQNILNLFFNYDINNNCLKDESVITQFPSDKIKLLKEVDEEEEENTNDSNAKENLLLIKDEEKPEIKIKINQFSLEIIQFSYELLKMYSIFHKDCYGFILASFTKLLMYHLNFQIDQIYNGKGGFQVSQQEMSMTYGIFLLIEYIYEHLKNSEFFVTVANNSEQSIYDNYLDLSKNITECNDLSKNKIAEFIENHCINETLTKLQEIQLPYYNVISGDVPVNEYALHYISSFKDIYNSMTNCYEESFIKEMINKVLDEFFDKFEDFILHGKKIEDENCLKQFKRDMTFLKKNLVFLKIIDLTEITNRIETINKSVLPESMRTKKK